MSKSFLGRGEVRSNGGEFVTHLGRAFYLSFFDTVSDAVYVVDGDQGEVLAANEVGASQLGYDQADLVGKHLGDLFSAEHREAMPAAPRDYWTASGPTGTLCEMMNVAGVGVNALIKSRVVRQGETDLLVLTATVVGEDDSISAALHESIRQANDQANLVHEAAVAKSRFIANLTHELRTPLNALIGMSDLLTGMELEPDARETAEIVASSAKGLLGLVNDVLDFAKIEAGKMEMRREAFALKNVLQGVTETFALSIKNKGLRYEVQVGRDVPPWLVGDEGRLRQVLVNLVGNALKFTAEGGVTVEVSTVSKQGENVAVKFNVVDTGCGINEDDQAVLFDAYTQAANQSQGNLAGTGLGLTISRQLVELMGGDLVVSSQEGWGSTFGFTVRFAVGAGPNQEIKPSPAEGLPGELHVLLAEDNKVNQTVALGMMRKLGITAVVADDGEHALALLSDQLFDLVFMDVQMPKLDGLQATEAIRAGAAGDQNREIPIIAMTGRSSREDRQLCLNAGMNGYVTKPISSERIHEAILDLAKIESTETTAGDPFVLADLVTVLNGDLELAAEILDIFFADTEERLQVIARALNNGNFEEAAQEARAVEGGAVNLCARNMVKLARELAEAATNQEHEFALSLSEDMAIELKDMMQSS